MLIGLLSDTHIPETMRHFPEALRQAFAGVELILHAGDIYVPSALDELQEIAPVLAARGDDDMLKDSRVKEKHLLEVNGLTIGLIHVFEGLYLYWGLERAVASEFGCSPDIIVFGHTHSAAIKKHQNTLLINPGSALLPNYRLQLGSVGILEIKNGQTQAHLVELK